MAWLAAAIFGVAVLYFAIHHPGFRKVVLIALVVIVVSAALGGGYLYWNSQQQAACSAYAKTLINKDDIDFFDLTMGTDHMVRGNIRNRSTHPLKAFKLQIIVEDCPANRCETIGEDELWETFVNVPPGQVRAFDSYVSLYGMPTPKVQQWNFRVTELEAKLD